MKWRAMCFLPFYLRDSVISIWMCWLNVIRFQPPVKKLKLDGGVENNIDGLYVGFLLCTLCLISLY